MSDQTLAAAAPTQPTAPPAGETFATPDEAPGGYLRSSEIGTSLGEQLGAEAEDNFMAGSRGLLRLSAYSAANGIVPDFGGAAPPQLYDTFDPARMPTVPIAQARDQVKAAGLDQVMALPAGQDTIKQGVLDLMMDDARDRAATNAAVARGPRGFLPGALGAVTSLGLGMIDPLNIAAFSIPVIGEARYGKLLASAGESILGRAAVRGGVGAAQGAVGGAALLPFDWLEHTQDGQDYTFADALQSVVMSAGMGAGFHAGGGLLGDLFARVRGRPLQGAPAIAGTHVPEELLGAGVDLDEIPGITPEAGPLEPQAVENAGAAGGPVSAPAGAFVHPAETLADLPPAAQEDVVKASIANLIEDRPNNAAEMLQVAAKVDPRIAESLDVGHEQPQAGGAAAAEATPATRGPRARPEETWSLNEFLASRGGIDPNDPLIGDLRGSIGGSNKFIPGFGHLIRKGGMRLDRAREAAVEAGYLRDAGQTGESAGQATSTPTDLLDAMDRELRGERVYRNDQVPEHASAAERARAGDEYNYRHEEATDRLDKALKEVEIDPRSVSGPLRDRTVEIMMREGVDDPVDAYERAVMEEHSHGAETGELEPFAEKIPGWDEPDEPGAASPGGAAAAGEGDAEGAGTRGASRQPGAADRAARTADWQSLRPKPEPVDDAVHEAAAAGAEAPPPEATPEQQLTVLQREAAKADQLLDVIKPMLTEEERGALETALSDLKNDEAARAQVARDAAACLLGAATEAA